MGFIENIGKAKFVNINALLHIFIFLLAVPQLLYVIRLEDQLTPACKDLQVVREYIDAEREKEIVYAIAIWCKSIGNVKGIIGCNFDVSKERVGALIFVGYNLQERIRAHFVVGVTGIRLI